MSLQRTKGNTMKTKTPKYHSTKPIVKKLDAIRERIKTLGNDDQLLKMVESAKRDIVDFDNKMWGQTKEMSEYLPV